MRCICVVVFEWEISSSVFLVYHCKLSASLFSSYHENRRNSAMPLFSCHQSLNLVFSIREHMHMSMFNHHSLLLLRTSAVCAVLQYFSSYDVFVICKTGCIFTEKAWIQMTEFFFIHLGSIWIYVVNHVQRASCHLSVFPSYLAKTLTLNFKQCTETFQPNLSIPDILKGTIDSCHFLPPSVTLTLVWVHRSAESKVCWLCFLTHFSTDQDEYEAVEVEHPDTNFEWDFLNEEK